MKDKLKSRQAEILRHLLASNVPLDIEFFKEKVLRSERTIRYDLQELKEICNRYQIEIKYLTKKGYYIPVSQKSACSMLLEKSETKIKETFGDHEKEERYWKIFFYLFVQKNYVAAGKIAEANYVSRSTLTRFLSKMENYFGNQVTLDVKKALGYRLAGDELVLRRLATGFLSSRFKGSYAADVWYYLLPEVFKDKIQVHDIREIGNNIREMNAKYNIWISNTAYLKLMSYSIVRFIRLPLTDERKEQITGENTYASELLTKLSGRERGRTNCELRWLSTILEENGIYAEEGKVDEDLILKMLDIILAYLRKRKDRSRFYLEELRKDLYEHLKSYLNLSQKERMEDENEHVLEEVREYYYFYYQLAQKCAEEVKIELGQKFSEMEICYLAVYLYKNSIHKEDDRKNVMIVCATGKGLSHFLTLRIKNVFPMLNVVGQISPYQLSKASDLRCVDFVISTIPLEHTTVPVVKISGALLEEDIKRIQDFLRYGKMLDEIPMKQKDEASFLSKEAPLLLEQNISIVPDERLAEGASTMSWLILTLLEYTAKIPPKIQISQDAMLGMIIHMSMAVSRWFSANRQEEISEDFKQEYYRVKVEYPDVFCVVEEFCCLVESTLQVNIPISERVAFFLYIIEEG